MASDPRVSALVNYSYGAGSGPERRPERVVAGMLAVADNADKMCGVYRVKLTDPDLVRGLAVTVAKATGFSPGRAETLVYQLVGEMVAYANPMPQER